MTFLVVAGPPLGALALLATLRAPLITWPDVTLAVGLYVVSGLGITVGYHRLFAHRSFHAARWLRIVLAAAGSLALEGSVTAWVAAHRQHHAHSDRPGDPHSPHEQPECRRHVLRGLIHAHVGWLFSADATANAKPPADLLADPDVARVGRMFPLFAVMSVGVPLVFGWAITRSLHGALMALLWAGFVRITLLQNVTWSVNSICHTFGAQPATTKDQSRNVAALAVLSFGESWHNFHHAHPSVARHGALPHQLDPSAAVIRVLERAGCATHVRWPSERLRRGRVHARRRVA